MGWYVLGWILIVLGFVITQSLFYRAHRRAHGWWREPGEAARTTLLYTPAEYRAMFRATFRTDPDPNVERARLRYLFMMALGAFYFILGISAASLL